MNTYVIMNILLSSSLYNTELWSKLLLWRYACSYKCHEKVSINYCKNSFYVFKMRICWIFHQDSCEGKHVCLLSKLAKTYHIVVTLSLETVKHYGLAAAASGRPWWTDEHPDKGICHGRPQAFCQAKKVGGLATTYIRSSLINQQC